MLVLYTFVFVCACVYVEYEYEFRAGNDRTHVELARNARALHHAGGGGGGLLVVMFCVGLYDQIQMLYYNVRIHAGKLAVDASSLSVGDARLRSRFEL